MGFNSGFKGLTQTDTNLFQVLYQSLSQAAGTTDESKASMSRNSSHAHSPKPVLSAVTYQTSIILAILLKWLPKKWVGEYRKTSKYELWSH